jgi:hypothetical protein
MTTQIRAAFEIAGWDETPFGDGDSEGHEETKLTVLLLDFDS